MMHHVAFFLIVGLSSCSHTSSREKVSQTQAQAKPRIASYGADLFYIDSDYREKKSSIPADDFFFKKCRINQLSPYPAMHEWDCTEAMK